MSVDLLAELDGAEIETTDYKPKLGFAQRPETRFTTKKTSFPGWTARVNMPSLARTPLEVKFPDAFYHAMYVSTDKYGDKYLAVFMSNHASIVGEDGKVDKAKRGTPVICLVKKAAALKEGRPQTYYWEAQASDHWVKWVPSSPDTLAKYDTDTTGSFIWAQKDMKKRADAVSSRSNPAAGPDAGEDHQPDGSSNDIPF